jgi:lysophospholipase L1-like esterase
MRSITPAKILVSLLSVLTLLLIISAVFPASGVFQLGQMKLKFIPISRVIHPKTLAEKETVVQNILATIDTAAVIETDSLLNASSEQDSLELANRIAERLNFQVVQKLEFGEGGSAILAPFFEKLKSGSPVRILHYGDSQIEGDRMTGFLRQKLQTQFGGTGVGLVVPSDVYSTTGYVIRPSPEWKRYTGFSNIDPKVKHKKYGVMAAFSRFTDIVEDSSISNQPITEAWIEVGPSKAAYGNAQLFSHAKLMYGNCRDSVWLKVYIGSNEIHSSLLIDDKDYHVIDLPVNGPALLKYVFKGKDSPDIYAFSLEGTPGVLVDNIALRGASGTFFNNLNQDLQRRQFNDLSVDLFILQFGGNTVPYLQDEKQVTDYASWLKSQIRNLKKMVPGATVILIGPSDMSTKVGETFATYPLLPKVVTAMKNAAHDSDAAYWDMYAAMGGENSMVAWVEKNLAGNDYTHFSPQGSKYIIQMFYEALMQEYSSNTN